MRYMVLIMVLYMAGVISCDTDSTPSATPETGDPAPKLVGSWQYASASFIHRMHEKRS